MRVRRFVPPPPGECNGTSRCLRCDDDTMHTSGMCWRCGDWLVSVPASEVTAGDLVLDCGDYARVHAVARYADRVQVDVGYRIIRLALTGRVWVAASARPRVGMVAA